MPPKIPVTSAAITNANHKGNEALVAQSAATYPPNAMSAPCPSEICPEYPVSKIIEPIAMT